MEAFIYGRRFRHALLLAIAAVLIIAAILAATMGLYEVSIEEGPLETSQEVFLLIAAIAFGAAAFHERQAGRMAAFGACVLSVVFFLRELELPVSGPVTAYLNSHAFRWHEGIVVAAIAIPYLAARWRYIPAYVDYLRKLHAWPYVLTAVLLLVGEFLDGRYSLAGIEHLPMFLEETAETVAYLTFAFAGCATFLAAARIGRRRAADNT
ncbi:hypothetical protein [Aquamicrobium sp. LC103]|uniref:hypothetical protein n=1 Tax=Aquamicrobium sp. LC103 TaxID=1120658 RepID=UPI00063EBD74|nr:hypothetical protein [Aquamicrobium sp. LC103]TKT74896.1 hypothetical protein XW59_020670 [Aquamicrobium sp. LC103]